MTSVSVPPFHLLLIGLLLKFAPTPPADSVFLLLIMYLPVVTKIAEMCSSRTFMFAPGDCAYVCICALLQENGALRLLAITKEESHIGLNMLVE